MRRWEYTLVSCFYNSERVLNEWGRKGWEYVGRHEGQLLLRRRRWRWRK